MNATNDRRTTALHIATMFNRIATTIKNDTMKIAEKAAIDGANASMQIASS